MIMGNPGATWWNERDGIIRREKTVHFDTGRLRTGLEVIANHLGKRLDEDNPILHTQLRDGSRLAAVIPPVVRPAPALTIRKFTSKLYTVDDLMARGTLTRELADYLGEQISNGKTLLISGGTGTGKTTLLNILAQTIPEEERIVVIDTSELRIQKPNVPAVECQTDTFNARISFDDFLKSALRWRPDRIILVKYAESKRGPCLIPSTRATPVPWQRSMRIRPKRLSIVSPILSCVITPRRLSPTSKQRSGKRLISPSTWNES
jgi:pilus assembly protein CpaF